MVTLSPAEKDAIVKLLDRTEELIKLNKFDEAEHFLDEVSKYVPGNAMVSYQRGAILLKKREFESALPYFFDTQRKLPNFPGNINNIAVAYFMLKQYGEAISYYKKYLELKPDTDFVLGALAMCHFHRGDVDEAIKYFGNSVKFSTDSADLHSNILLAMIYTEAIAPEDLVEEAKRFGENMAKLYPPHTQFANIKDKKKKLKIGYVSPDFRDHPVPYFIEPLLRHHDRSQFEIYAYSNKQYQDAVTERLKTHVDHWREIQGMSVEKCCDLIIEDGIDILIDLAGHTGYNSLKVFARRAAPIQATWLGYTATTGVQTMDYRITDVHAEPEGMTEHLNSETLWRLPHIFAAYNPHEKSPSVIDHPPFEDNGYVTFGSMNNFSKVTDSALAAWGRILAQVQNSRILLEIHGIEDPALLEKLKGRLARCGISFDRVIIEPKIKSNQFVLYNRVDIALDPFPCVGGTTSMDTLWMGVPFVTLAGKHFASRMGISILKNVNMPELIAEDVDQYISIAVDLANDREKLKKMRHNLRERFAASPAMNHELFTREMEAAYRGMWEKYCDTV